MVDGFGHSIDMKTQADYRERFADVLDFKGIVF